MKAILFILSQFVLSAFALENFCAITENSDVRKMSIPYQPNYFFRAFPDSRWISYASSEGNFIYDMNTLKQYKLPGIYDPVPLGEGVMSIPSHDTGMTFYATIDILRGNSNPQPLARSEKLLGVYQSVGLMRSAGASQLYGVIVAGRSGTLFQKILVTHSPLANVQVLGEPIMICEGIDLKLPMISKNAQEISGLDMKTGTTKIWKIHYDTRKCEEVDDLGIAAGKADFSFNGKQLTFHLRADAADATQYFKTPDHDMSMNVFVYDRQSKKVTKVSMGQPGDNAYYPVFRRDGSVIYAITDAQSKPWFAHADMRNMMTQKISLNSFEAEKRAQHLMALGKLWNSVCFKDFQMKTVEALITTAITMKKAECKNLVDYNWNEKQEEISHSEVKGALNGRVKFQSETVKNLTKRDLEETCDLL